MSCSRAPLELVFKQELGDRSVASKIEHRIKKLPRHQKEKIVDRTACLNELINDLD
jgi:putative endonuclease